MSTHGPAVELYGDGGIAWRPVSPALAITRSIVFTVVSTILALSLAVLAVLVWEPLWLAVAVVVVFWAGGLYVVRRQVSAVSWAELEEELVIRKGRVLRSLVSVPFGRLQYVDVQSGPLSRRFGMASVELHTASPESGGSIPGLPIPEAEALRERLAARGESQRAGL